MVLFFHFDLSPKALNSLNRIPGWLVDHINMQLEMLPVNSNLHVASLVKTIYNIFNLAKFPAGS